MNQSITHAMVVEKAISEQYKDSPKAAGELRSNFKSWCASLGTDLDSPAELTLGSTFSESFDRYQNLLTRNQPGHPRAGKNVRTAAVKMQAVYLAMLASQDLPADFNAAFKTAMDAKGMKPAALNRILKERYFRSERPTWYGAQLWGFYDGTAGPGSCWKGDSRLLLARCEKILGLLPNMLVSRAYPVVEPVRIGPPNEIPYRQARSSQWSAKYALAHLPQRIERIFNDYADWRFKREHFIDGQLHSVDGRNRWGRPASASLTKRLLKRYLGWMCLPAPSKPLSELTEEERWRCGKGMAVVDLMMAHLLDTRLLWEFIEFQRFRQHNKTLTKGHLRMVEFANTFISQRHSFLPNHPELAEEFGLPAPTSESIWLSHVEDIHQRMLQLLRGVRRQVEEKQRSPDDPLRHVMNDPAPYTLLLQMIERLEQAPPLKANVQTWCVWARDVALFRMQSEVPLRSKNLVYLNIGGNLNRDKTSGVWRLFVSKDELKNYYSGHANDIDRAYSVGTSSAIDRYVDEARNNLVGASESSVFFLGPAAGRRASAEFVAHAGYRLSTDSIDRAVRKHLLTYFGAHQGNNIFRHLIATSILKDDPTQIEIAAAVLNNSPNAIKANYRHLTQTDGLRLADDWFRRQPGRLSRKGRTGSEE